MPSIGGDDSKRRRDKVGDVPFFVKALLLVVPLAYLVLGYGLPGGLRGPGGGEGPLTAELSRTLEAAAAVPVPRVPRSIIKYYDGNTVVTYDHYQPGQTANWWSVVNHNVWEADTLACIRHVLKTLRPNSVYVDFGAWVGPTAIFASSYARHVYALEPDPGAYNELHYNVAMNPHVSRNTETNQLCISDAPGVLEMHGELGSSMSTLLEYPGAEDHRKNNNTFYADFKVQCMTLQEFLAMKGINPAEIGLIKMDTEGGEAKILPQLKPWLLQYKPNILLSLHSFLFKEDKVAHANIKDVIGIYAHPIWLDGRPVDVANFNTASDGYLSAIILTDTVITGSDIAASNVV